MTAPAVLTQRARAELREAVRYLGTDNPAAARGLNDAVHEAAMHIGAHPAIGARRPILAPPPYRFWPVRRYGYLLVYTDAIDPPRILRIVHTARDLPNLLANLRD